jgi:hypothetical protein
MSSEIKVDVDSMTREDFLEANIMLSRTLAERDAEIIQLRQGLELKDAYIRNRSYANFIGEYAGRTYKELLDTVGQLHISLTEADCTIDTAQQALEPGSDVWNILDDYDGSMDNIKKVTKPFEDTIDALRKELLDGYERERNKPNYQMVVVDLCRCKHGRVQGDPCFSCAGGMSPSREGIALGHSLGGTKAVVIPSRDNMHKIEEWYK